MLKKREIILYEGREVKKSRTALHFLGNKLHVMHISSGSTKLFPSNANGFSQGPTHDICVVKNKMVLTVINGTLQQTAKEALRFSI